MPSPCPFILPDGIPLRAAYLEVTQLFQNAGIETAALDARLLICHVMGLDHAGFIKAESQPLSGPEARTLADLAGRRKAYEPVARIIGETEFWSLPFRISPAVLDPRPDTETLVVTALEVSQGRADQPLRLLDLGTGSGCVLLSLLTERERAGGLGVDQSAEALAIASDNAARLGLSARATFLKSDWFEKVHDTFDIIVSNPPYIAAGDIAHLAPDVKDYDPLTALTSGPDGLEAYRAIIAAAGPFLAPNGWLLFECGDGQAAALSGLLQSAAFASCGQQVMIRQDLAGIQRVVGIQAA